MINVKQQQDRIMRTASYKTTQRKVEITEAGP